MERQQIDEAMALMRMEFLEMPELKLTLYQARRLWNLPADVCEVALRTLVGSEFLVVTREGSFLRRSLPSIDLGPAQL
jgi:hypothetical protein